MRKIKEKIVPMNVASLNLDFVMDSDKKLTCIIKHPSGAILDLVDDIVNLPFSIQEIVDLAIDELSNAKFPGNE